MVADYYHVHARLAVDVELAVQAAFRMVRGDQGAGEVLWRADMDESVGVREHNRAEVDCPGEDKRVGGSQDCARDIPAAYVGGLDCRRFRLNAARPLPQKGEASCRCGEKPACRERKRKPFCARPCGERVFRKGARVRRTTS